MSGELSAAIERTLHLESDAIRELADTCRIEQVQQVIDAIQACTGKVVTSGCGTSGTAARKIAHTLSCVECPALFLEPADAVHGGLGVVQPGDVVILFTKGGQTEEMTSLVAPCQAKGAVVVGVTQNPESDLGRTADILLEVRTGREPDPFNMLATASILGVLAMFDAITIELMQLRGFTKAQFALIHPGGAVGKRLNAGG
ncbi:KpsF/GutQ family protein [Salana multivorans]|uniref:KpsF/GutQ family protein n=1 Tax=Salana multivorans TaxID=120377 RepID=A0A3N2D9J2_9MICO|nr:SIS domain-containing protein [Salana multivorans]MBN8881138.1 SIS domain-containing protein [Salana multivorans]ROR96466.1 KpsF/GutQ family protein [Salana multivorans]